MKYFAMDDIIFERHFLGSFCKQDHAVLLANIRGGRTIEKDNR